MEYLTVIIFLIIAVLVLIAVLVSLSIRKKADEQVESLVKIENLLNTKEDSRSVKAGQETCDIEGPQLENVLEQQEQDKESDIDVKSILEKKNDKSVTKDRLRPMAEKFHDRERKINVEENDLADKGEDIGAVLPDMSDVYSIGRSGRKYTKEQLEQQIKD